MRELAMSDPRTESSIAGLFSDVISQTTHLFRTEIRLAKTELGEKVGQTIHAAGFIIAGAILLIGSLYLFLLWIVRMLVVLGVPEHWATLAVSLVAALVGYVVLKMGMSRVSASNLVPRRTVSSLEKDTIVAKEVAR
jgi:hypothetical protein